MHVPTEGLQGWNMSSTPWIVAFPRKVVRKPGARPRPALLRAWGKSDPPEQVVVAGACFELVDIFKHDSWAATALYALGQRRIVCKFNRRQSIFGLPMVWLGRWLARREGRFLRRLANTGRVPIPCGAVFDGDKRLSTVLARQYILGDPLGEDTPVGDEFFAELSRLLECLHERGMAYVDLHKRENVLVGDDGHPHLIDFQVAYAPPVWAGPLGRMLLNQLQQMDRFHVRKLQWRFRPDQVPGGLESLDALRPALVRWHRRLAPPLRSLRRWLLVQLGVRKAGGRAETEVFPEAAFRPAGRRAA